MKRACLRALLLLALMLAAGVKLSAAPDTPVQARVSYTLPFILTFSSGPIVQVMVNDKITGTFLVDTGSSANIITDVMVAKLGLTPVPFVQGKYPFLLDGKKAMMVTDLNLKIGQLTLQGSAYPVIDAKTLRASVGVSVDGIISMQALRYFAMDVDFSHNQMILTFPGGLTESEIKALGFSGACVVPLMPNIDGTAFDPAKEAASSDSYWRLVYSVPVQISDGVHTIQQNSIVDTGAKETFFPAEISKSLKLDVNQVVENAQSIEGKDRSYNTVIAPRLGLGSIRLSHHTVNVYLKEGKSSSSLGLDVLGSYHILMDFEAKKMFLQPNSSMPVITIKAAPTVRHSVGGGTAR